MQKMSTKVQKVNISKWLIISQNVWVTCNQWTLIDTWPSGGNWQSMIFNGQWWRLSLNYSNVHHWITQMFFSSFEDRPHSFSWISIFLSRWFWLSNTTWLSCFVMLRCCFPLGVIALILSGISEMFITLITLKQNQSILFKQNISMGDCCFLTV